MAPIPSPFVPAVTALTRAVKGEPPEPVPTGTRLDEAEEELPADPATRLLPFPRAEGEELPLDAWPDAVDRIATTAGAVTSAATAAPAPFAPRWESVWRVLGATAELCTGL